ncbi:EF-P 5-aminopentanol modification-associated protein YfmF [Ferroacidibacillus organovorans]|uniref:Peptidase M16 C-terminal domain-containing protein n=1 Tax=Ferroacidibacillus organovorans TaxID=1765683 RepID=A0A1V4EXJ1_9BACL|nr:pitrilysin family protein [Ferroacidibacillus organovorans]OPG17572.1 hypothetical protein B2M26_01000 [Ferroacidibacillus organovorans]
MNATFQSSSHGRLHVHTLQTKKYKTATLWLVLERPLSADDVTEVALLPRILLRGTERYKTPEALMQAFDALYGAGISGVAGKHGDLQTVEFHVQFADETYLPGHPRVLDEVVQLLADVFLRPAAESERFNETGVEVEKDLHRQRIENLVNDKAAYAGDRTLALMCKEEPFGVPRMGYADRVGSITPAGLYKKYREILRDATVHLYAVGNFTKEHFDSVALRAFASLTEMRSAAVETDVFMSSSNPTPKAAVTIVEQMDVQQGVLCVGLRSSVFYKDDMYPALLVYNGILGGFPHSKLFVNVREKASLAYYASSRMFGLKGVLLIQSGIQIDHYEQAKAIILEQIRAMETEITEEERSFTIQGLINQYLLSDDQPLTDAMMDVYARMGGKKRSVDALIEAVQAVTIQDVQAVARTIWVDTIYFLRDEEGKRHA